MLNQQVSGTWAYRIHSKKEFTGEDFGTLDVGIADRLDLIFLKLEAAADQPTADSRHFRDLVALQPAVAELHAAYKWAREKNVDPEIHDILERVISHVNIALGRNS